MAEALEELKSKPLNSRNCFSLNLARSTLSTASHSEDSLPRRLPASRGERAPAQSQNLGILWGREHFAVGIHHPFKRKGGITH